MLLLPYLLRWGRCLARLAVSRPHCAVTMGFVLRWMRSERMREVSVDSSAVREFVSIREATISHGFAPGCMAAALTSSDSFSLARFAWLRFKFCAILSSFHLASSSAAF